MGGWCMPGVCDVGVDVIMGGRLSVSFKTPLELTVKDARKIKTNRLKISQYLGMCIGAKI